MTTSRLQPSVTSVRDVDGGDDGAHNRHQTQRSHTRDIPIRSQRSNQVGDTTFRNTKGSNRMTGPNKPERRLGRTSNSDRRRRTQTRADIPRSLLG